jgi:hypothetical protein
MKIVPARDVPVGAALAIVALVLVASVVTGREQHASAPPPSAAKAPPAATPPPEDLDIDRLHRSRAGPEVQDLFASRAPVAPPPAPAPPTVPEPAAEAAPTPPPAPVAPPLPYRYLGSMTRASGAIVYLVKNDAMFVVAAGDTLEATYRVDDISDSAIHLTYLPLGSKEVLSVPRAK